MYQVISKTTYAYGNAKEMSITLVCFWDFADWWLVDDFSAVDLISLYNVGESISPYKRRINARFSSLNLQMAALRKMIR